MGANELLQRAPNGEGPVTLTASTTLHDLNNLLLIARLGVSRTIDELGAWRESGAAPPPQVERVRADLTTTSGSLLRATEVVSALLDSGRPAAPGPVDATRAWRDVLARLRPAIAASVEVLTVTAPELRPAQIGRYELEEVLTNLVLNALRAMPNGGTLGVSMSEVVLAGEHADVAPGSYVAIEVSDTGIGMDAKVVTSVFEPWFTAWPDGVGTGLGLAGVHAVVTGVGGWVGCSSERDAGTTFRMLLPASID